MTELQLGFVARDKITGFSGVLTGRAEYDNGCIKWLITPQRTKEDGSMPDEEWFDEQRLTTQSKAEAGGGTLPPTSA